MEIVEMVITKWNAKSQKQRSYREEGREEIKSSASQQSHCDNRYNPKIQLK